MVKTFNPKEVTSLVKNFLGTGFIEPERYIAERDYSAIGGFGIKSPLIGIPFVPRVIKPVPKPDIVPVPYVSPFVPGVKPKPTPRLRPEIEKPYVYPGGFTGEIPKPSLKEGVDPTAPFPVPTPLISGGEVIASEKRTPSEPEKVTPITEKIGISKSFIEGALPLIIGAIVIYNFLK